MLDPMPRALLIPGLGLVGVGKTRKDAVIAGDVAEMAVSIITRAEAIGRFTSIAERDIFDVEYWSLEQAKLGKGAEKPLARQVVVVTGEIGRASWRGRGGQYGEMWVVAVAIKKKEKDEERE